MPVALEQLINSLQWQVSVMEQFRNSIVCPAINGLSEADLIRAEYCLNCKGLCCKRFDQFLTIGRLSRQLDRLSGIISELLVIKCSYNNTLNQF